MFSAVGILAVHGEVDVNAQKKCPYAKSARVCGNWNKLSGKTIDGLISSIQPIMAINFSIFYC